MRSKAVALRRCLCRRRPRRLCLRLLLLPLLLAQCPLQLRLSPSRRGALHLHALRRSSELLLPAGQL